MHAYLIMAHSQPQMLKKLLESLDDYRNALFVHVDIKMGEYDQSYLTDNIKFSKIYFVDRKNVVWGDYTQIDCEMALFKYASNIINFDYYHLLSGVDFPLKSQDEIHEFFEINRGKEFVHIESNELQGDNKDKVNCYFFFQKYIGNKNRRNSVLYIIQRATIAIQKKFKVSRHRNDKTKFYKGANWVSITDNFVRYLLSNEEWIKKEFKYSLCCDEIFLQTVLMNSDFAGKLYDKEFNDNYESCMRLIDWERGNPYVYQEKDFQELINSKMMFARKFEFTENNQVINMITNKIQEKNNELD